MALATALGEAVVFPVHPARLASNTTPGRSRGSRDLETLYRGFTPNDTASASVRQ